MSSDSTSSVRNRYSSKANSMVPRSRELVFPCTKDDSKFEYIFTISSSFTSLALRNLWLPSNTTVLLRNVFMACIRAARITSSSRARTALSSSRSYSSLHTLSIFEASTWWIVVDATDENGTVVSCVTLPFNCLRLRFVYLVRLGGDRHLASSLWMPPLLPIVVLVWGQFRFVWNH